MSNAYGAHLDVASLMYAPFQTNTIRRHKYQGRLALKLATIKRMINDYLCNMVQRVTVIDETQPMSFHAWLDTVPQITIDAAINTSLTLYALTHWTDYSQWPIFLPTKWNSSVYIEVK